MRYEKRNEKDKEEGWSERRKGEGEWRSKGMKEIPLKVERREMGKRNMRKGEQRAAERGGRTSRGVRVDIYYSFHTGLISRLSESIPGSFRHTAMA